MVNGWSHQLLLAGPASQASESAAAAEIRTDTVFDDCPELAALVDMLGTAEVHKVVALLVEVTRADIAVLDRAIRTYDYDQATQQLHRIVGSYHLLGPSALADEGRDLLAELRTERSPSTLPRLWLYRDRVMALAMRLEKTVVAPHDSGPVMA